MGQEGQGVEGVGVGDAGSVRWDRKGRGWREWGLGMQEV